VSTDTAPRLGRYFGTGPEFCINIQAQYDLQSVMEERGPEIERQVQPREA
jgi:plasmid maintenance system antidote protein VapI